MTTYGRTHAHEETSEKTPRWRTVLTVVVDHNNGVDKLDAHQAALGIVSAITHETSVSVYTIVDWNTKTELVDSAGPKVCR